MQKNGLLQGRVLAPLLCNICTNDQPLDNNTKLFVYADDLCKTCQHSDFREVEATLTDALNELQQYYEENYLKANPAKTQIFSFHLKNREADRPFNIFWQEKKLENCPHPTYLGVTLDRSLTFRKHVQNCKAKVSSQ